MSALTGVIPTLKVTVFALGHRLCEFLAAGCGLGASLGNDGEAISMRPILASFSLLAIARSAAAKGGSDRLARSLGALERRESASISGGLLSFPSGTPAWRAVGRSLAARAIAAPAHWLPAFTRGEARRVAGPAPCDVTPRRRSEATSTGARRMAWGGVGYQVAQNGQESLARGQTRGSVGPQARATPIAAPSRERSDGVGGGPRRQEPQRVAVGDKQQRGMDAAPPC